MAAGASNHFALVIPKNAVDLPATHGEIVRAIDRLWEGFSFETFDLTVYGPGDVASRLTVPIPANRRVLIGYRLIKYPKYQPSEVFAEVARMVNSARRVALVSLGNAAADPLWVTTACLFDRIGEAGRIVSNDLSLVTATTISPPAHIEQEYLKRYVIDLHHLGPNPLPARLI